jgi:hypothetical protein
MTNQIIFFPQSNEVTFNTEEGTMALALNIKDQENPTFCIYNHGGADPIITPLPIRKYYLFKICENIIEVTDENDEICKTVTINSKSLNKTIFYPQSNEVMISDDRGSFTLELNTKNEDDPKLIIYKCTGPLTPSAPRTIILPIRKFYLFKIYENNIDVIDEHDEVCYATELNLSK